MQKTQPLLDLQSLEAKDKTCSYFLQHPLHSHRSNFVLYPCSSCPCQPPDNRFAISSCVCPQAFEKYNTAVSPESQRHPRPHPSRTVVPKLAIRQRPTRLRPRPGSHQQISVRQLQPSCVPPILSPSMYQPPQPAELSVQDIRDAITSSVSPGTTIASIILLPSREVHRVYEARLSNGLRLQVVIPPSPLSRLLRSEQMMTQTEAIVVRWLRDAVRWAATDDLPSPGSNNSAASKHSIQVKQDALFPADEIDLLAFLPTPVVISHSSPALSGSPSSIPQFTMPFNIFNSPSGTPISAIPSPLTPEERMAVDYQAGRLARRFSHFTPASGKFGPALAVLAPQPKNNMASGMAKWSVAFHSILESILRDGEDVAVALAYPTIRRHFRRLSYVLDAVTTPALVVVDLVDDTNLMVQRMKGPREEAFMSEQVPSADIHISGIRDWSRCVFGDPLFASVFCEQPSAYFLSGFNGAKFVPSLGQRESWAGSESKGNKAVRLLLYRCYHSIVQIVKGFYRPGQDQTVHELAARKRLTEILGKLDKIDEEPMLRLRHQRPTGEMSPAKKPKSSADGSS